MLNDSEIIALFYERSEQAIKEISEKYGKICFTVSKNILGVESDAEECVNDAYLALWQNIPPENPNPLRTYLFRVVRNISTAKYHSSTAQKRNSFYDTALEELEDCLYTDDNAEQTLSAKELSEAINRFLKRLPEKERMLFVRRYWYFDSISDISARFKTSKNNVSVRLSRIRKDLKEFLRKEGYEI